jgi:hypothetical protein
VKEVSALSESRQLSFLTPPILPSVLIIIYRYITSDTIALEATGSNIPFYIHEGLLRSISPALSAACRSEWKEGTVRRYKFREEVTEQMLLCFLTWAYNNDYHSGNGDDILPSSVNTRAETNRLEEAFSFTTRKMPKKGKTTRDPDSVMDSKEPQRDNEPAPESPTAEYGQAKAEKANEEFLAAEDDVVHPLLLHLRLYVFAHTYLIGPLKVSAKKKMIDQLQKFGNLSDIGERAAVFDVLAYAFYRLPEDDPLLYWLGRYASWRIEDLRQMSTRLDDLLSDEDSSFAKMLVRYVNSSNTKPFDLNDDQIMPRYPITISKARYNGYRGF